MRFIGLLMANVRLGFIDVGNSRIQGERMNTPRSIIILSLLFAGLFSIPCAGSAESGSVTKSSSRETLKQYVAALQESPDDLELRGKIIKLAATMKPKPAIPEEIIELKGQATAAFKQAKTPAEYGDAVDAYQKALLIAPWLGDLYFNLGVAQEKAEKPMDAIQSFKLYLLASPDSQDREAVLERIGGLKYTVEKAAKEKTQETKKASDNRTTIDNKAGLMWVKDPVDAGMGGKYNWAEAMAACERLNYAGHTDWRLPSKEELASIVIAGQDPTIDTTRFLNTQRAFYWTSTTSSSSYAWSVPFIYDYRYTEFDKTVVNYVRCVRAGP